MLKYVTWTLLINACLCEYSSIVTISQGKLKGLKSILTGQNQYLSIPYAVSERFRPPQSPPQWKGIFHATNPLVLCAQKMLLPVGSENCTVLNIYTPPNVSPSSSLPVMVFIHGGSYFYGSGSITNFDATYLVEQGVIVVTINYRLGIFGFLCLGVEDAPGNVGLKDQVAALRWVRENIAAFGGHPERVTIFGESAGAASVSMHMISKSSQGLFQSVIMQSGSSIAPWAINMDPISSAKIDARKFGINSNDPQKLLRALQKPSAIELLHYTKDSVLQNVYKYCPCVETKISDGQEPYLTDTPYNLLRSGNFSRVPVMMGMNSAEGIFFAGLHTPETVRAMNKRFVDFLPRAFKWSSLEERHEIEWKIRHYYFGNDSIMDNDINRLINFYSDTLTGLVMPETSNLLTKLSDAPVYNYLFSYEGGRNFMKYFMGIKTRGVSHADELFYIFKLSSIPLPIFGEDKLIMERMVTMWANFAKTGNPTPEKTPLLPVKWMPSESKQPVYINIDSKMSMIRQPFKKRTRFWEEMFSVHGIDGVAPAQVRKNL